MTGLDEPAPLRYSLTQWHKSFGVITLLLVVWRIFWRLSHPAPAMPEHLKPWEKRAAGLTHILLYLLIFVIPVSGWISVSASPLELPTLLFNKIPWPHLPPFDQLPEKGEISQLFGDVHVVATYLLIFLLCMHIAAAFRHRLLLNDGVMERMSPKTSDGRWLTGTRSTFGVILFVIGSLVLYGFSGSIPAPLIVGNSQVSFEFTLQNQVQEGVFTDSTVDMLINPNNSSANQLRSVVNTTAVSTGNSQIDSTLVSADWFDSDNYPQAFFDSHALISLGQNRYTAMGILRIKGIAQNISFPVTLIDSDDKRIASGNFIINRMDFNLGRNFQPGDETVGYPVTIKFNFEVR